MTRLYNCFFSDFAKALPAIEERAARIEFDKIEDLHKTTMSLILGCFGMLPDEKYGKMFTDDLLAALNFTPDP